MPPTEFVQVIHPEHGPDAKPGKVPARSLDRWKEKGYVEYDPDGNQVAAAREAADLKAAEESTVGDDSSAPSPETLPPGEAPGDDAVVVDPVTPPEPVVDEPTEPGTAAVSADTTSTSSNRRRGGAAGSTGS